MSDVEFMGGLPSFESDVPRVANVEEAASLLGALMTQETVLDKPSPDHLLRDPKLIGFKDFRHFAQPYPAQSISRAWAAAFHCLMQHDIGSEVRGIEVPHGRMVSVGQYPPSLSILFAGDVNPYEVDNPNDFNKAVKTVAINTRLMQLIASNDSLRSDFTDLGGSASEHALTIWQYAADSLPNIPASLDQSSEKERILTFSRLNEVGLLKLVDILRLAGITVELKPLKTTEALDLTLRSAQAILTEPPRFIN